MVRGLRQALASHSLAMTSARSCATGEPKSARWIVPRSTRVGSRRPVDEATPVAGWPATRGHESVQGMRSAPQRGKDSQFDGVRFSLCDSSSDKGESHDRDQRSTQAEDPERPRTDEGHRAPRVVRAVDVDRQPFAFMRRFASEMDRLFEDFGLGTRMHIPRFISRGHELLRREAGLVPAEWSPRINVLQREGKFVVRADLPGLSKDDVKVEVSDDLITIQGERKHEKKEEREGYCYSECSFGSFYRAIPMPEGAEGFEGDRGVPQRRARGHRAGGLRAGAEAQTVGSEGREVAPSMPNGAGGM